MADPVNYEKLKVEELEELVKERELSVTGTGENGKVLKDDLIKALQDADDADEAAKAALTGEDAEGSNIKYSVERLVADSYDLLGYPRHYAAGALHGKEPDDELTVSVAKSAIKQWLEGEVE